MCIIIVFKKKKKKKKKKKSIYSLGLCLSFNLCIIIEEVEEEEEEEKKIQQLVTLMHTSPFPLMYHYCTKSISKLSANNLALYFTKSISKLSTNNL